MKKIAAVITITSAFLLSGCSESEITNTTQTILEGSNEIQGVKEKEITSENSTLTSSMLSAVGVKDEDYKIEDVKEYSVFKEKIADLKKKTSFKINEIKLEDSGNRADVLLDISYIDIGDLTSAAIGASMERTLVKVHKKEKISEELFYKELVPNLNKSLEIEGNKKKTEIKNASIKLKKKENKWEIEELSDEAMVALTLNMSNGNEKIIFAKKQEIETNRDFIENEKNLKRAVEVVRDEYNKRDLNVNEFISNKEVKKEIKRKLKFNYELTNKVGKSENVYYISVAKKEIKASVLKNGQLLSFSKEHK